MTSDILTFAIAVAAGIVSAVTGFGIGSLLTPVLALRVDTRLAVAAVSVPHVLGTAVRFVMLKGGIDRRVLLSFGLTSAAGGLAGALAQRAFSPRWLTGVFAILLLFAAASEFSGLGRRLRFRGPIAWLAGGLSGLLGGLVGNQGGIRSAALLGFNLERHVFVGTATAVALFVDGARLPVYLATQFPEMLSLWRWMTVATLGVVAGTFIGSAALNRIPERLFRRVLAVALTVLGVAMLVRALNG